jgi:hypothetical protein
MKKAGHRGIFLSPQLQLEAYNRRIKVQAGLTKKQDLSLK